MNKIIVLLLTTMFINVAFADENQEQLVVEHYSYGTHLDIAEVVKTDTPANVCGVVTTHMIYLDSVGKKHNLEYNVMGDGCSNG